MTIANPRAALSARYEESPESAWATHLAWTETSGDARSRPGAAEKLLAEAGRYSEVLQTLRSPMPIEIITGGPYDE
jgi:hypothetical protein